MISHQRQRLATLRAFLSAYPRHESARKSGTQQLAPPQIEHVLLNIAVRLRLPLRVSLLPKTFQTFEKERPRLEGQSRPRASSFWGGLANWSKRGWSKNMERFDVRRTSEVVVLEQTKLQECLVLYRSKVCCGLSDRDWNSKPRCGLVILTAQDPALRYSHLEEGKGV